MTISEKKLRERLMDITEASGLCWNVEDEYWEGFSGENISRTARAISTLFGISTDPLLRCGWLSSWDEFDSLAEHVMRLIKDSEQSPD